MRLILDTNVLVSASIQRGYPYFIVDRIFADDFIMTEYKKTKIVSPKEFFEIINK